MTTPNQLRAARALLGMTQAEVAAMISTSTKTIRRAEVGDNSVSDVTIAAIQAALENENVEFIAENGGGAGVRMKK